MRGTSIPQCRFALDSSNSSWELNTKYLFSCFASYKIRQKKAGVSQITLSSFISPAMGYQMQIKRFVHSSSSRRFRLIAANGEPCKQNLVTPRESHESWAFPEGKFSISRSHSQKSVWYLTSPTSLKSVGFSRVSLPPTRNAFFSSIFSVKLRVVRNMRSKLGKDSREWFSKTRQTQAVSKLRAQFWETAEFALITAIQSRVGRCSKICMRSEYSTRRISLCLEFWITPINISCSEASGGRSECYCRLETYLDLLLTPFEWFLWSNVRSSFSRLLSAPYFDPRNKCV